jgi:hypothetical protein
MVPVNLLASIAHVSLNSRSTPIPYFRVPLHLIRTEQRHPFATSLILLAKTPSLPSTKGMYVGLLMLQCVHSTEHMANCQARAPADRPRVWPGLPNTIAVEEWRLVPTTTSDLEQVRGRPPSC